MKPKTLKWYVGTYKTDVGDHLADTSFGQYSCREMSGSRWTLWFRERCLFDAPGGVRYHTSLLTAMDLAQEDFNRRVYELLE